MTTHQAGNPTPETSSSEGVLGVAVVARLFPELGRHVHEPRSTGVAEVAAKASPEEA